MEFVNGIAKIVHMEVSLHGGAPNKNIGDAFLLVWKLPKGYTAEDIPRPIPRSTTDNHRNLGVGVGQIREPLGFGPIREPVKIFEKRPSKIIGIHAHAEGSSSRRTSLVSLASPSRQGSGNDGANKRSSAKHLIRHLI